MDFTWLAHVGLPMEGGSAETIQKGRRRVVTYLSVLCLILLGVAAGYQEWIYGGLEFDPQQVSIGADGVVTKLPASSEPMLGATVQRWFTLGLSRAVTEGDYTYRWSQEAGYEIQEYDVAAYVRNLNSAMSNTNSRWYGFGSLNVNVFPATLGLLGFAAFLQGVLWLLMALVQYDLPALVGYKYTALILRIVAAGTAFFTMVGVLVFMTSSTKTTFCKGYDPDDGAGFNGLPCVYGASAGCAISALVFQCINALVLIFGVGKDLGANYSFKSGFEEPAGAAGASSFQGSFQGVGESSGGDVPFKSAYQDA